MKKHLICHIHCLDHPNVLKLVQTLKQYKSLFDIKVATITEANKEVAVLVKDILSGWGFKVFTVPNSALRETAPFFEVSLPYLLEHSNSQDLLYYCHSKGVTYYPLSETGKAVNMWTDLLIDKTLKEIDSIPFDDLRYSAFGTLKIGKDFLPDELGENFSYVGTYFWIRINKLIGREFEYTKSKFYLEGLPGLIMGDEEGYSIPPTINRKDNPYHITTWSNK